MGYHIMEPIKAPYEKKTDQQADGKIPVDCLGSLVKRACLAGCQVVCDCVGKTQRWTRLRWLVGRISIDNKRANAGCCGSRGRHLPSPL